MIIPVSSPVAKPSGPISGGLIANNLLFTSQIPKDPDTGKLIDGDIKLQTTRTLQNLRLTVEAAGGTMGSIVQVIIYLTNASDAEGMNSVYAQYFSEPYPNRATVVVKELLAPKMRIELVAYAALGGDTE